MKIAVFAITLFTLTGFLTATPDSLAADNATGLNPEIKIVLVGDSTVADTSGWGMGFKCYVNNDRAQCVNLAAGGRSSMSYMREMRWANARELKADYYLIQFGHNDQPGKPGVSTEPDKGYREYMTRYVDEARAIGAQPVLITPLTRREFGKDGKIHSSLEPYAAVVRQIAVEKHVPLVDLQASSIVLCDKLGKEKCYEYSDGFAAGKPGNTHLNAKGSVLFARLVVEGLVKAVPALEPCFRAEPVAPSELPTPRIFNVRDYGATGDGSADDTESIQKALDVCWHAGGGIVRLPAGTYLSRPLFLRSQTTLQLDKGAVLRATDNFEDFAVPERKGSAVAFINGNNLTGVAITGKGIIDGNGERWWKPVREAKRLHQAEPRRRPRLVIFSECLYVRVKKVTLENSPSFHLVPKDCEDVDIDDVTIHAPADAPNTDAIDPSASRYLHIANCVLDTGDDNIAIKSGHIDPAHPGGAAEHITITNCTFLHGHGLSIGSETLGGVRDVAVESCTFNGTTSGIRIKSARGRGGVVENLVYKNITMTNVDWPVYLTSYYPKVPESDTAQPMTPGTPVYRNIRLENLTAYSSRNAGEIIGLPECAITNVVLKNVHISAPKGMTVRNARAVEFKDSSITVEQGRRLLLETNAEVSGFPVK